MFFLGVNEAPISFFFLTEYFCACTALVYMSQPTDHLVCVYSHVAQSASREGEFKESDDCSLLLFRWLALTPQAPSG